MILHVVPSAGQYLAVFGGLAGGAVLGMSIVQAVTLGYRWLARANGSQSW